MVMYAGTATNPDDIINRCPDDNCIDPDAGPVEQRVDKAMRRIAGTRDLQVQALPNVTFVHVVTDDDTENLAYTIIRNKALSNNSMLFNEGRRRILENDTLTVVNGYVGSYPNAFSRIPIDQIEAHIDAYLNIKDELDYYNFAKHHAIQRNSPNFWEDSDWHYRKFLHDQPIEAGLFDMYRFHRIAGKSDARFS